LLPLEEEEEEEEEGIRGREGGKEMLRKRI